MSAISTDGLKNACKQLRRASTKIQVEAIASVHDVGQFPEWFKAAFKYKLKHPNLSLFILARYAIKGWIQTDLPTADRLAKYDPMNIREPRIMKTYDAWRWLKRQPRFAICNAVIAIFLDRHAHIDKYCAALLICMYVHYFYIDVNDVRSWLPGRMFAQRLSEYDESEWVIAYPRMIRNLLDAELGSWGDNFVSQNTSNKLH